MYKGSLLDFSFSDFSEVCSVFKRSEMLTIGLYVILVRRLSLFYFPGNLVTGNQSISPLFCPSFLPKVPSVSDFVNIGFHAIIAVFAFIGGAIEYN